MALLLLSHVPLQLHCITAVTASHGSALTLSRATAATLHHCSHCLTWQCTYSGTCHCSYTASLQSLPHMAVHLLWHVPLQLHCITAVTASHGSALTLARATAAALHHCAITASRGTALTLSRATVATHCTTRTCTLFFPLYIYKMQTVFLVAQLATFFKKKKSEKKKSFRICFFRDFEHIISFCSKMSTPGIEPRTSSVKMEPLYQLDYSKDSP